MSSGNTGPTSRQSSATRESRRWGERGAPLVPATLRKAWQFEVLPSWVFRETKLHRGSSIARLDSDFWRSSTTCSARLRNYIIWLTRSRRLIIEGLPALDESWPTGLEPDKVPWKIRTRNALDRGGLLQSLNSLSHVTYGKLFSLKGMDAVSVLDFACTAEAAFECYRHQSPALLESASNHGRDVPETDQKISEALLNALDEPWAEQVSEQDPRFARFLPPGEGTIFERVEALTSASPLSPFADGATLATTLPRIRTEISQIESFTLEEALTDYLRSLSRSNGKRLEALVSRFGWNGQAPSTLEESAKKIGVTRERLRQLQARVQQRFPKHPVVMPALDRALEVMRTQDSPISLREAARLLAEKGISAGPFNPLSLLEAAQACGRTPTFEIVVINKHQCVATNPVQGAANLVIQTAKRQAGASGVSNCLEVLAECGEKSGNLDERHIKEILERFSEVQFLVDEWFWYPAGKSERNRLINFTRKMLSVASPIHLSSLREGVRRAFALRQTREWRLLVPPRNVLEAFYKANPDFEVGPDGLVASRQPLDFREELAETEIIMVMTLRSSPSCLLDRASLLRGCLERGMNENTFSVYSTFSPIIEHLGIDLWTLRGVRVDPAAVEALRAANAARPRERRLIDHGWTAGGLLWVAARLPGSVSLSVVGIPSAVRRFLAGREFVALSEQGSIAGTIRVSPEGACWGFAPFLRRSGADENDTLVIEFDVTKGVATLRLGSDEILEEYTGQEQVASQ